MAVGVEKKNLPCAVGARLPPGILSTGALKVLLPFVEIIDFKGKVVVGMAFEKRIAQVGDEMQFLLRPQPKPGTGEVEGRAGQRRKMQYVLIELDAALEVSDVNRDVVQFQRCH